MDCVKREYGLGKARVWTGKSKNMDCVKRECALDKERVYWVKRRVWIG